MGGGGVPGGGEGPSTPFAVMTSGLLRAAYWLIKVISSADSRKPEAKFTHSLLLLMSEAARVVFLCFPIPSSPLTCLCALLVCNPLLPEAGFLLDSVSRVQGLGFRV